MENFISAVTWLDRWFRDNPEATHEEGNKALEQAKQMELEQQQKMVDDALTNYELGWADRKASSQTEISDEEIIKYAKSNNPYPSTKQGSIDWENGFIRAIKWYREQLKKK